MFQGWGLGAFYGEESLNPIAFVSKAAEVVLAVCSVYLYASSGT